MTPFIIGTNISVAGTAAAAAAVQVREKECRGNYFEDRVGRKQIRVSSVPDKRETPAGCNAEKSDACARR